MMWGRRGRPSGEDHSYSEKRLVEYLAKISVKYEVDSDKFFAPLVNAWKNKRAVCENLVIECREKMQDQGIFLLTSGGGWIAQFPLPEHVLKETNPLKELAQEMLLRAQSLAKSKAEWLQIEDLSVGRKHVKVKARVLEVSKPREVLTRFGSQVYISNALIADDTGTIELSLWNEQADGISVGNVIEVEDGTVAYFRGVKQLRIMGHGRINIIKDEDFPSMQQLRKTCVP